MLAAFSNVFTAVMPVVATIAAGYFLRKRGLVETTIQKSLMRLTLWIFFPALVLARVPHNAALHSGNLAWATPLAGFLTIAGGIGISLLFASACGVRDVTARRTFAYCVGIFNYGYVAIPLCESLIGADAVAILLLFNAGVEIAIWTVGLIVITGKLSRDSWKNLLNPMALSSFGALALNKTGVAEFLPKWLCGTFSMLGACAIPVGLLLVGMALPALVSGFSWRSDLRAAVGSCVLRNVAIPLAMLLPVIAFPAFLPAPLGAILALQAAMPAAFFPIVVAQHYGGDARTALRITLASSAVGVVTLPLWMTILSKYISGN